MSSFCRDVAEMKHSILVNESRPNSEKIRFQWKQCLLDVMVVWNSDGVVDEEPNGLRCEEEANREDEDSYYGFHEIAAANPKYGAKCGDEKRLKDLERSFRDVRFHLPRKNREVGSPDSSAQWEGGSQETVVYEECWVFQGLQVSVEVLVTETEEDFCLALEYSMAIYQSYVLFQVFIGWPFFGGAMFYLVGAYANFLEVINAPDVHPVEDDIESLRKAAERYRRRHKYRWFGWYPYRIDYLASLIQLIGAGLYSINCFVGNGSTAFTLSFWETEFLYWLPDTLGSICFVVSEYMFYVEYSHGWWCWNPKDVSFWAVFLNVWGAVGFLLDGGFGFGSYAFPPDSVYAYIATNLTLLIGCICFLIGSFLLIVEQSGPDATLLPGLVKD
ncbi:hypothetical protein Gasu2_38340 [Galdieria sulphuraria]|nr:hypothetical protein Gasu2_38340 [Galdieria sulphuraria]